MTQDEVYNRVSRSISAAKGQCVLILGPELSVNKENGKGYKVFFRELVKDNPDAKYFDRENLFFFKDRFSREFILEKVIDFYKNVGDGSLLEMVTRIPFPLIINVCPDKALNEYYQSRRIPFAEGYFTKDSKVEFNAIPMPTKENPVIYNILGSIDLEKSLLLTHNKLYETVEYLLPKKSLPDNIEQFLEGTASCFIFLGFKFDSWQYQLVCHKLKIKPDEDSKTNISTPYFDQDQEDVAIIMQSSFGMESLPDSSIQCLQKIIAICELKYPGALRPKANQEQFACFVSYAWKDDEVPAREQIVDLIQSAFSGKTDARYKLFRDRNDQHYGDSIDSFMTRIGMGKTVIRVISDKYLKSIYCMTEALRIDKYADSEKRVFTIVLEDALLDNAQTYKDYWWIKCKEVLDNPNLLEGGLYDNYLHIYRFVDDFIHSVKDELYFFLRYSDISANQDISPATAILTAGQQANFDRFMESVLQKLKEN